VLADFQRRFQYVMVDEYQDTNVAQYLWLRLLAQGRQNVCCVGDDDQSIYGWRGAEVDNILRFERDFPGAKVVKLERNYRSTEHILAAAAGLINANKSRLGKTLWTEIQGGEKVKVSGVWDGEAESRMVADEIEKAKRAGRKYSQMAILVRASFQMRAFEERFVMLQIPYKVVGGPRFFERAEIRDAHAYLRLIQSPDDDLAFERIVNTPKRGIGDTSVQKLLQIARLEGISTVDAARVIIGGDDLPARTRTALSNFLRDLDRWRPGRQHPAPAGDGGGAGGERLYRRPAPRQGPDQPDPAGEPEGTGPVDGAFDTLEGYLEHVSLVMDLDKGAGDDAVWIMTLHSAKGLEFPLVFLPGWEEGVFPSQRSMDDKGEKGLEEERRLAYVGITRAREEARISFVANRQVYGRWTSQLPSRFVDELPLAHVDAASETGYYGGGPGMQQTVSSRWDDPGTSTFTAGSYDSPGWKRAQERTAGFGERSATGADLARRRLGRPLGPDRGRGPAGGGLGQFGGQRLYARRPGVPRQVRLRQGHRRRGQQAHACRSTRPATRR
jgi:DNA helicase-2/ATP-dependent DNA helicase PcrA